MSPRSDSPPPAGAGLSVSSVLLSVLMTAGGVAAALVALHRMGQGPLSGDVGLYGAFGIGGLAGGFLAARASRRSPIAACAIGAALLTATLSVLVLATPVGWLLGRSDPEDLGTTAALAGGATLAGALLGSWISARIFGESTRSWMPWVLYVGIAVVGGSSLAVLAAAAVRLGDVEPATAVTLAGHERAMQVAILVGIGAGCVIAGLCAGAAARTRPLAAGFLGAALAVFGLFLLAAALSGSSLDPELLLGAGVIAAAGGLLTLLATALGWAASGKPER
jgi:hypothetical protein